MAFTVTDDHEAQERVWRELPKWQKSDPSTIRDMLTEHEITASDRRVKFVGPKAYEKAGGTVRRDLFSEDGPEALSHDAFTSCGIAAAIVEIGEGVAGPAHNPHTI